jgi:hypothetical protein
MVTACPKPKRGKKHREVKHKTERQRSIDALDKLWGRAVKAEAPYGICQKCKVRVGVHPHHVVSRAAKSTRWDSNNGIWLCAGCHFDAHIYPERFREWLISVIGEGKYRVLQMRGKSSAGKQDLELIALSLKARAGNETELQS